MTEQKIILTLTHINDEDFMLKIEASEGITESVYEDMVNTISSRRMKGQLKSYWKKHRKGGAK